MKCNICGGIFSYKNEIWQCENCGATTTLEDVYENVDVCICYEENDSAGRRTRDSIIAQEVYRKLEESKVATFYERVSADGIVGDELEMRKVVAIHKAKIIIVLGTTNDIFAAIEAKYGDYFNEKTVIPFCIDVNPGTIPQTLTKIQAMSYSTIGWEKDLVNGIYSILGREKPVNNDNLYTNGKRRIITICSILALSLVIVAVTVIYFVFRSNDVEKTVGGTIYETEGATESTEATITVDEMYDKANTLLTQGNLIGALELFSEIPDHPNTINMIHLIYSKYEGYYQDDIITLHFDVVDNNYVDVKLKIVSDGKIVSIDVASEIVLDEVLADYVDNNTNSGTIGLTLVDDGIVISIVSETINYKTVFDLSQKTDEPVLRFSQDMLFDWLKKEITYTQISDLGYKLEYYCNMTIPMGVGYFEGNSVFKIEGTDVYLSMVREGMYDVNYHLDDSVLIGVAAPANIIAPTLIGKDKLPSFDEEVVYWPEAYIDQISGFKENSFASNSADISYSTIIGTTLRRPKYVSSYAFPGLIEDAVLDVRIRDTAKEVLNMESISTYRTASVTENNTHYLYKVSVRLDETFDETTNLITITNQWMWCKVDKVSWETTLISERKVVDRTIYYEHDSSYSGPDFFTEEYPVPENILMEFPDLNNASAGTGG